LMLFRIPRSHAHYFFQPMIIIQHEKEINFGNRLYHTL
jgi:hypothetical protein